MTWTNHKRSKWDNHTRSRCDLFGPIEIYFVIFENKQKNVQRAECAGCSDCSRNFPGMSAAVCRVRSCFCCDPLRRLLELFAPQLLSLDPASTKNMALSQTCHKSNSTYMYVSLHPLQTAYSFWFQQVLNCLFQGFFSKIWLKFIAVRFQNFLANIQTEIQGRPEPNNLCYDCQKRTYLYWKIWPR